MSDEIIICSEEPKPTYFDPSTCEELPNDWFKDVYLDPSNHRECILEVTQILGSMGMIQDSLATFLEVHIFPKSGFVYIYRYGGVPVESTETITAAVLEVVSHHGITGTAYIAISR